MTKTICNNRTRAAGCGIITLGLTIGAALIGSTAHGATIREENVYVKLGQFWTPHGLNEQTAYMYKERDGELIALPNNTDSRTSAFRIMDLIDGLSENDSAWFIGVPDIRVFERVDDLLVDHSSEWQYTETVHHMVMKFNPVITQREAIDPCGNRIWPILTGSEMTPYSLDLAGQGNQYAMYWRGGDELAGAAWHYNNPAGLPHDQEIFVRFTLRFDIDPQSNYTDVNVSWIRGGGGCTYDFCLSPGEDDSIGPLFKVPERARLVAAVPHIHDHALAMQLYKTDYRRITELIHTSMNNSNGFTAAHHCHPDGAMIPAHSHPQNETGHLPWRGLVDQVWYDANKSVSAGDRIFVAAEFDVPNHDMSEDPGPPVDEMAIYILFWTPQGR